MALADQLALTRKRIEDACIRSGRDPKDVLLVAVSKTKPEEDIMELYEAGHRAFGENYVQELRRKHDNLPGDIEWHMIGHLQRNKVKYIAPFIAMIHSVDTPELAQTIEKEAAKCRRVIPVLAEVNVGEEESKFGVSLAEAPELAEFIETLPHLEFRGFMTSAPPADNPEEVRYVFRELRELSVDMNLKNHNNNKADVLSMGMSGDFETAVEEGSTCVRVGSCIFGERKYAGS